MDKILNMQRLYVLYEQKILPYYQGLMEREKRLALGAAVILPLMLLIFAIILPLQDARMQKQGTLAELKLQVQEAEALAVQLQKQGSSVKPANSMTLVDQIARQVKVREFMTRLRPQMGQGSKQRLLIQLRDAPYDKSVRFFDALSKQGLTLLQAKFQQAKQAGYIHVQAVVE
ncbi:MAG: type II secretion system protein GspM [Mariprofundaceae bacterium]|nr:type II secretion system protein GspM [Mariprofundaceae bacterium]